jgi:hypothetical protein
MTRAQLDPSAHAPWPSTTLTSFIANLLLPGLWEGSVFSNQFITYIQVIAGGA